MLRYKTLLLFACLLTITSNIGAQQILPEDIPTPNASDLGKYGDIPVSYYTGRASISIPLFSTEYKNIPLSMSMDYDTSGIRLNSLPGWTGQNWTLNVGGVITRTVEDRQDELEYPPCGENIVNKSGHRVPIQNIPCYFKNYNKLPNWIQNESVLKDSIGALCGDLAPDIFTFNFMGKTGKFFLGNDGEWKVLSDDNLDILMDINDNVSYIRPFIREYPKRTVDYEQPKTIRGFIIRDGDGNSYYFGYYQDINGIQQDNWYPIDYSISFFGVSEKENKESWKANSWYLTEVRDRHNNLVYQFQYERGVFLPQLLVSWGYIKTSEWCKINWAHYFEDNHMGPTGCPVSGSLESPVYLKRINSTNGITIEFNREQWEKSGTDLYPGLSYYWRQEYYYQYNEGYNGVTTPYYYLQSNDYYPMKYQYREANDNINRLYNPLASTRLYDLKEIRIYNRYETFGSLYWKFTYNNSNRNMLTTLEKESRFNQQVIDDCGKFEFEYNDYSQLPNDYLSSAVDHYGYYNGREFLDVCNNNYNIFCNPQVDSLSICREPDESCTKMGMLNKIIYPTGGFTEIKYEGNTYNTIIGYRRSPYYLNEEKYTGGLRVKSIYDCDGTDTLRHKTFAYEDGELHMVPKYTWNNWHPQAISNNSSYNMSVAFTTAIFPLVNYSGSHIGYSKVTERNMDGSYKIYRYSNFSEGMPEQPIYKTNIGSPYDKFSEHGYKRGKLLSEESFSKEGRLMKKESFNYVVDDNSKYVLTSNMFYNLFWTGCEFYTGGIYKLYYPKYSLEHSTDTIFYNNGRQETMENYYSYYSGTKHINYPYEHNVDIRLLTQENHLGISNNSTYMYSYPFTESSNNPFKKYFLLCPTQKRTFKNGYNIITENTIYRQWSDRVFSPEYITQTRNGNTKEDIRFTSYSPGGALTSFVKDGVTTNLKWDFFEGRIKRKTEGSKLTSEYTYTPLYQVASIKYPNGYTKFYDYDISGRLIRISDGDEDNRKTIQEFQYNLINY